MSHQVEIDYRNIAARCESICEVAEAVLQKLDDMLAKLQKTSASLSNDQTKALAERIESEKSNLRGRIGEVRKKAEQDALLGTVKTDYDVLRGQYRDDTVRMAEELRQESDRLQSQSLVEFEGLLSAILGEKLRDNYQRLLRREAVVPPSVQRELDLIEDVVLRNFTYLAYLRDNTLSGEALLEAGRIMSAQTYEQRCAAETEKIRAELAAAKLDGRIIEKVLRQKGENARVSLSAMRSAATQELVGEKCGKNP